MNILLKRLIVMFPPFSGVRLYNLLSLVLIHPYGFLESIRDIVAMGMPLMDTLVVTVMERRLFGRYSRHWIASLLWKGLFEWSMCCRLIQC